MKQVFGHCINVKLSLNVMAEANLCRLCAAQKDSFVGIYEEEGHKLSLESKITKCLQIELYPKDPLPKAVCLDCCAKLNQCSDFFEASAQAQVALHMILLQPKKEELVVLNVNKQSSDPEQSAFLQPQQDSNSCEDDPTFESDSPEYIENVMANSVPEGPNEDSDSLPSSKRKRKTPIRWTLQTEGVPQTNTTELPETRGNHQIQTTTNTMKETESVSHMCAVSGALPELEQTVGGNEEASPRKRRDGWDKYPWMCTDCAQELPSMQALRNHHQTVHNQAPRFMCAQCSKVYTKYYGFVSHVRRHRNHMKFCCEQCGKCFSNKKVLESHRATHSDARPYVCSECGKTFRQQSALYVHSRSHQPENIKNRFPCDQCDKRFSTKPNLVTHKRIHSGVRNFTCDQCGKSFIQKGNLDAHLLTHSSDKPHLCPVCNKGFKTPLQLRKHQSVHTGAKPHQCDVCGRQFRERGTLREHHRIHTGAMPFTCEFCGKCFRFKGILTTHRRQHTGERPYSCLECQHHFTNWPNYNKHMKRRHGINTSHQPDPNKIALANLAASSGAQPANILVMQHPINQQPVVTSEQQRQHQPAPHQPLPPPPPPPSLTQQQQPSAILVLGPAVQMDHSSAVSAVQYSHHTGVPVSSQHLQVHSVDRSPVGGTHFYSPAQTAPYNTAPPSVLGFYNLQPTVPGLENTSGPMDMLPPVQQR